jgi:hypothetical protein
LRWLLLATPLALLPSLGSSPESRLLFPPLLGWSITMALGFSELLLPLRSQLLRAGWASLYACQLLGPPMHARSVIAASGPVAESVRGSLLSTELNSVLSGARHVLLLGAADATTTIYIPLVRRVHGVPWPVSCQLLSATSDKQSLERVSATAFRLTRAGSHLSPLDIYATAFNRYPLYTGQRFRVQGMRVTVERAFEGRPMSTLFELDVPLDDRSVVLLQQTAKGLRTHSFPRVGSAMWIEPPIPPLAFTARAAE